MMPHYRPPATYLKWCPACDLGARDEDKCWVCGSEELVTKHLIIQRSVSSLEGPDDEPVLS